MGEKKKAGAMLVRLVSAAGTGFFYVVKKTKRLQSSQIKLEFRKYDPRVNRHVLFTEAKMKWVKFRISSLKEACKINQIDLSITSF